jgi:hypothetical protein
MIKTKKIEEVIFTFPEFQKKSNEIAEFNFKLNKVFNLFLDYSKANQIEINYSLEMFYYPEGWIKEAFKKKLPENLGGAEINKDLFLNNIIIPDYSSIILACNDIIRIAQLKDISINELFILTDNCIILNDNYLDKLKKSYSVIATTLEASAVAKSYFKVLNEINNYNNLVTQYIGKGAKINHNKISEIFSNYEDEKLNPKGDFLYLLFKSLNNL